MSIKLALSLPAKYFNEVQQGTIGFRLVMEASFQDLYITDLLKGGFKSPCRAMT